MSPRQLLLIDDDPGIGTFVRKVAEGLGFRVETETNAEDFLEAIERTPPDIIILDLTMPQQDGVELLHALSERECKADIFIMSGFDPRVCQMAFKIGELARLNMREIIHKPVRAAQLRSILAGA